MSETFPLICVEVDGFMNAGCTL